MLVSHMWTAKCPFETPVANQMCTWISIMKRKSIFETKEEEDEDWQK
jgi:hypothetical protein